MAADGNVRQILGILLLLVVNVVWVLSAEVTEYLFIDLNFKRPFFTTYTKSCLFSVFLIRYLLCGPQEVGPRSDTVSYTKMEQSEDELFENESLTLAEFEPISFPSDSEVDSQATPVKRSSTPTGEPLCKSKKVHFSLFREVRRLPEKIANEARIARLPYKPSALDCSIRMTPALRYTLYFAPLWVTSSLTYQAALVFSSVSTVNMISASSSLLVLVFSALFGSHISDRFSWTKLLLVLINLLGVVIVSEFSAKFTGVVLSSISALVYAVYLVAFSAVSRRTGQVDINLMFGMIGVFSFVVFTPVMVLVHKWDIESQVPLPTSQEMLLIFLNNLIGSIFSDYLWLYATLLTSSLVSSISLTLTIPLSLIADLVIRHQTPSLNQLIAAVPIMISFVGASFLHASQKQAGITTQMENDEFKMTPKKRLHDVIFSDPSDETESLMGVEDEL